MTKCRVPSSGHCELDLDIVSGNRHCVWCISPIFFEVGIPNLVCECILGWRIVIAILDQCDLDL